MAASFVDSFEEFGNTKFRHEFHKDDNEFPPLPSIYDQAPPVAGITVKIRDQEKRGDDYIVYIIEVHVSDELLTKTSGIASWTVPRRYSEFVLLRNGLEQSHPDCLIPPLPEKVDSYVPWRYANQSNNPEFILYRRQRLDSFLQRLLSHPVLCKDDLLLNFFREGDSWRSGIKPAPSVDKAVGFLKRQSAPLRVQNPPVVAQQLKEKGTKLRQSVDSLLEARHKCLHHCEGMHMLHRNYAEALGGGAGIRESHLSRAVAVFGHAMASYASLHDNVDSEESEIESMLNEYYRYGDSLLTLSKRLELAALEVETKEDSLRSLHDTRQHLQDSQNASNFSLMSIKTRLKGYGSPAEREQGLYKIQEDIERTQNELETLKSRLDELIRQAVTELGNFENVKKNDIHKCMEQYATLQMRRFQKGHRIWLECKESFDSLPNIYQ